MATAVTPKSVDETTQNEQHYLRLHLLVMKAGDVLRAKFDSIVHPNNLLNELRNYKRAIDKLQKDVNGNIGQSCGLNNVKADIDVLVKKNLGLVPPEMKSLREKTIWFFNEGCDEEFNEENYNDEYDEDGN
ncbi:hypothetical protein MAR_026151, partial [Mya arenaria]